MIKRIPHNLFSIMVSCTCRNGGANVGSCDGCGASWVSCCAFSRYIWPGIGQHYGGPPGKFLVASVDCWFGIRISGNWPSKSCLPKIPSTCSLTHLFTSKSNPTIQGCSLLCTRMYSVLMKTLYKSLVTLTSTSTPTPTRQPQYLDGKIGWGRATLK